MSMWSNVLAQNLPLDSSNSYNKYRYKQYKSCLSSVIQNVYYDAVSNHLMADASFTLLKIRQNNTLHIIRYSMLKCAPETNTPQYD